MLSDFQFVELLGFVLCPLEEVTNLLVVDFHVAVRGGGGGGGGRDKGGGRWERVGIREGGDGKEWG